MRLTLRTLLAYRDRVLKTGEYEAMHGRVQQSAMAGNLVKRIDALEQRTNLLAPPIEGKGLGADANTIAEYLDDTLQGEKVPELERICLESDVQLAELAQCHRLLSTALSTPVDVPVGLRDRIVALSDPAARAAALARRPSQVLGEPGGSTRHSSGDASNMPMVDQPAAADLSSVSKGKPRASQSRMRVDGAHAPSAAAVGNVDGRLSGDREAVASASAPLVAARADSIRPSGLDLEGSSLAHEVPEYLRGQRAGNWLAPLAIGGLIGLLCLLVWQSIGSFESVREMLAAKPSERDATAEQSSNNRPQKPNANGPAQLNAGPNSSSSLPETPNPAAPAPGNAATNPTAPLPSAPATAIANLAGGESGVVNVDSSRSSSANAPGNNATATTGGLSAAQWLPVDAAAREAVILVQAGAAPLHRLKPAQSLPSGTQIFIPGAQRPKLDLTGGPHWTSAAIAHMLVYLPEDTAGVPMVDLRLGRAIVSASSSGGAMQLATPAGQVRMVLGDTASTVAVQLDYVPQAQALVTNRASVPAVLGIACLTGTVTLQSQAVEIPLAAGQSVNMAGQRFGQPVSAPTPAWVDADSDRPVDALAVNDLSKQLTDDANIGSALQKLAIGRRPELRALAAQCLSLMGSWEWVSNAKGSLADSRDRSFWMPLIDTTRQIMAAHPENVDALTSALNTLDATQAAWRLQLWLGPEQTELDDSGLARMVKSLESDILIDRILAIYQLQRLTGKDFGYQAGQPSKTSITQWNRELAAGNIQMLPLSK